jgi:hypothetical protein
MNLGSLKKTGLRLVHRCYQECQVPATTTPAADAFLKLVS